MLFDVGVDGVDPAKTAPARPTSAAAAAPPAPLGQIKRGMTNAHWYKLGLRNALRCSWLPETGFECHPDAPQVPMMTAPDTTRPNAHPHARAPRLFRFV